MGFRYMIVFLIVLTYVAESAFAKTLQASVKQSEESFDGQDDFESVPYAADFRDVIEKLLTKFTPRAVLEKFWNIIKGESSLTEIIDEIKDFFGATSAVGIGLIRVLKNFGVASFKMFIAKILGHDVNAVTKAPALSFNNQRPVQPLINL